MSTLIIILAILMQAICGFSQPILSADPCVAGNDHYVLKVNDFYVEEVTALERYNWVFFKDLYELNLADGLHKMELQSCEGGEESASLLFYIKVTTNEKFKKYEIVPDPDNNNVEYQAKFDPEFAVAEVYNDGTVVVRPKTIDESGESGNCFINTLR